jgi:hypothetical protein
MNGDDEIWADEDDEPAESNEQYDAVLEDIKDRSNLGLEIIEAATDAEAISKAREWAKSECQKIGEKALLIVVGGAISCSHSEVIEP